MSIDAWLTVIILISVFLLLMKGYAADLTLFLAVLVLMLLGILEPGEAVSGFSNTGMLTIAMLFIVASAMTRTGGLIPLVDKLFGRPKNSTNAQFRVMLPVAMFSSVLNNTAVVAMMIPYVQQWARRYNLASSQLLIPLSYAAIVGGTCTLIGTSTNLIINDIAIDAGAKSLSLFELAWVGIPLVAATLIFMFLLGRHLLPKNTSHGQRFADAREYSIEMLINDSSSLIGKSIEIAGLRHLNGVYLVDIVRNEQILSAVEPREILQANDRLVFVGNVDSVVDLQAISGLQLADDQTFKLDSDRGTHVLVEAVIGNQYPFLDQTVKQSHFRNYFGAAIVAISREGSQLKQRIGDVVLRAGDVILLEAPLNFIESQRYNRNFLVISQLSGSQPIVTQRRPVALIILIGLLLSVSIGWLSMFKAATVAVALLITTRCISVREARLSVDIEIIVVIASALALGLAFDKTGAAAKLAELLLAMVDNSPMLAAALLFTVTALLTAMISNIAAAVLMFPVAVAIGDQFGIRLEPLVVILMVATSASFATPIGYQTNLMVYGPGNYSYQDFLRVGLPLTLVVGLVTLLIVPLVWPFS